MEEIIQIKCPFDGAVLSVKNVPGIETKNVTCPICKHKYPFTEFKKVVPESAKKDVDTEYPGGEEPTQYTEIHTELPQKNNIIGQLRVNGKTFNLKLGRNVVGRKGADSGSSIQLETNGNRRMSREHIVIDVKDVPGKGITHYLSLFKEKVNPTFVGAEKLLYGDCVVLANGDIIHLPDMDVKFVIPDPELTEF